jgi:hypothetical protein
MESRNGTRQPQVKNASSGSLSYMARHTVETPDGPKRKTIYGGKCKEAEKRFNNTAKSLLQRAMLLEICLQHQTRDHQCAWSEGTE